MEIRLERGQRYNLQMHQRNSDRDQHAKISMLITPDRDTNYTLLDVLSQSEPVDLLPGIAVDTTGVVYHHL